MFMYPDPARIGCLIPRSRALHALLLLLLLLLAAAAPPRPPRPPRLLERLYFRVLLFFFAGAAATVEELLRFRRLLDPPDLVEVFRCLVVAAGASTGAEVLVS